MDDRRATTPSDGQNGQRRLIDFAGTALFLLLQAAVYRAMLFLLADRPIEMAFYVGAGLLILSLGVCIWRLAKVRPAASIAVTGFVLQLLLAGFFHLM